MFALNSDLSPGSRRVNAGHTRSGHSRTLRCYELRMVAFDEATNGRQATETHINSVGNAPAISTEMLLIPRSISLIVVR